MRYLVFLLLACLVQSNVLADEEERRYNLIRLQAERAEQVPNDTMHVSLNTYGEDRDAAQLRPRPGVTGPGRSSATRYSPRAGAGSRTWNSKAPISRR